LFLKRKTHLMCDYSLHLVASRPAKVRDKLVTTDFAKSITRGFSAIGEPEVAVCLLPGTELAFDDDVQYERLLNLFWYGRVNHRVARFRQVDVKDPNVHHDALEFPNGLIVNRHGASIAGHPAASRSQVCAADKRWND
jgi:hypothetical protein